MKSMNKKALVLASILTIGTAGFGSTALAHAATATDGTTTTQKSHHKSSKTNRVRLEARLNQAVRDGVITDAQKTAFKTELKTLKTERKEAVSKTSTTAERQAERAKLKTELQSWASSNGFPLSKIIPKLAS